MGAAPGDYIVTGIPGEKYPLKLNIFEATDQRVCGTCSEVISWSGWGCGRTVNSHGPD